MHKSPKELVHNAQWRMAAALRLGVPLDVGPCATCSLQNGNKGETCEQSLAKDPYHLFCCKYGGARTRPHRAVMCSLNKLMDKKRHLFELYDCVKQKPSDDPTLRCAIMDVVSWFPVLEQLWSDVGGAHL